MVSFYQVSPPKLFIKLFYPHTCYMSRLSHSSLFDHQNNISWTVPINKLLIIRFSPLSSLAQIFTSTPYSQTPPNNNDFVNFNYFPWFYSTRAATSNRAPKAVTVNTRNCGPGFDSGCSRKWNQEYFLRGRGDGFTGLRTLLLWCAFCLDVWERQPFGNFRACPEL